MNPRSSAPTDVWAAIERERQRDRFVRRTSVAAWAATFVAVLAYAVVVAVRIAHVRQLVAVGVMPSNAVFETAMPLILVVGTISLLVATLSTVGVFLRLRTASLAEIQLRLAALEEMIRSGERA